MKALIIGAAGFVGHYLISHLRDACNWQVSAPSSNMRRSLARGSACLIWIFWR